MGQPVKSRLLMWAGATLLPGVLRIFGEALPENFLSGWFPALAAVAVTTGVAALAIYMAATAMEDKSSV